MSIDKNRQETLQTENKMNTVKHLLDTDLIRVCIEQCQQSLFKQLKQNWEISSFSSFLNFSWSQEHHCCIHGFTNFLGRLSGHCHNQRKHFLHVSPGNQSRDIQSAKMVSYKLSCGYCLKKEREKKSLYEKIFFLGDWTRVLFPLSTIILSLRHELWCRLWNDACPIDKKN